MLAERERQLEDAQLAYCRLAGIDVGKRGIGYIPWYREEYRNLAHVKVEEAQQKLQEQAGRLESAFMNDFVAEIDENVREAKREMDAINRELRHMPFGNDTYKFVMKEKPDRALFFRICRRLEKYMSSPQVYMNSARDDEEMENDIQEFMSIILAEEDEWEYTDYRRYFSYDMEISSRQGQTEITAELSKKQVPPATARSRPRILSFWRRVFCSATRQTPAAPVWHSSTRHSRHCRESGSSRWSVISKKITSRYSMQPRRRRSTVSVSSSIQPSASS